LVQPSGMVTRGSCLIHNWQEERATNHLDLMPDQEPGNEGFTHRHGHHGLLIQQSLSWPTNTTTMKDDYHPPHHVQLLGQGEDEPPPEGCGVYSASRKEMLEETCSSQMPTELVSTRHQDHHARGCQFTPLPPTEGPLHFSPLQHVTSIRSGDSPFRRNAAFSTPITEYLEQPLSCGPLRSQLWHCKQ
ncbi:SPAG8 protein, partial [Hemiprocne comata]|nr:SPAG8 protein [Hemiprocne comata]